MTLWQDPPPQTRRQARESERAAAQQAEHAGRSRRAGTASPTTAGEIPEVNTSASASAASTSAAVTPAAIKSEVTTARPTEIFQAPPRSGRPEPLTSPVAVLSTSTEALPAGSTEAPADRTLTRRELRAIEQAQEATLHANGSEVSSAQEAPISYGAADLPSAIQLTTAPPATDQPATDQPSTDQPSTDQPSTDQPISAWHASDWPTPAQPARAQSTRAQSMAEPTAGPVSARPFADILAPQVVDESSAEHQPATVIPPIVYESQQGTDALTSHAYTPPTGHWSIAAHEPDDADPMAANAPGYARSRVSSGTVTTTNALILPLVPSVADATGPLTSTGEILVTGSIDLPRSLGSTGAHSDRFDSSDIDHLFEQGEDGQGTDAIPIRASRAVSSHTSTRDVITPPKGRGNKLPTVLAITAAVLALGVVALLVAGYVLKVF